MSATYFPGQRQLILLFCTLIAIASVTTPAYAAMVTTDQLLNGLEQAPASEASREALKLKLIELGVDADDVGPRVAALSEREAFQLASAIDEDPAGGGVAGAVIVFLVLVFRLVFYDGMAH